MIRRDAILCAVLAAAVAVVLASTPAGAAPAEASGVEVTAYTATWCGPCTRLKEDFGGEIAFVDVDEQPEVARRNNVRAMPTIIATANGREVGRTVGYHGRVSLRRWITRMQEQHR